MKQNEPLIHLFVSKRFKAFWSSRLVDYGPPMPVWAYRLRDEAFRLVEACLDAQVAKMKTRWT